MPPDYCPKKFKYSRKCLWINYFKLLTVWMSILFFLKKYYKSPSVNAKEGIDIYI